MKFVFSAAKDKLNRASHDGLSLADANKLDLDTLVTRPDTSYAYGEDRWIGFARMRDDARLYTIVFVELSDEESRVISLRKATSN